MDLETLLQIRSDDAPSGEDPTYGAEFMMLELAAQPGEERQVGDVIIAAEDPDFKAVLEAAEPVLQQAHDLRAGILVAWAELRLNGLAGFAAATAYIRGCLEQYWDSCHPQLDADDDNDPTERVNAVLSLAAPDTILRSLRVTALTDSRTFGRISLRDIQIAEGEITAPDDIENPPDSTAVAAAFQDTDAEALQALLAAAQSARDDIAAIGAVFDAQVPAQGPDLEPLEKLMAQVLTRLEAVTGGAAPQAEAEEDLPGEAGQPAAGVPLGAISSPNDVHNALDRIIAYYARHEPSSPVPILLQRAKRLVNADFMTIVRDMAPSGVDNVNLIGGLQEDTSSWE